MSEFLSIGYGNVGRAIPERCVDTGLHGLQHSPFIIKSKGTYKLENRVEGEKVVETLEPYDTDAAFWERDEVIGDVQVAFITLPSSEDTRELEIIERLQERGITVVTAAKGALADHFERLEPGVDEIGKSATVGGGTRMLPHLLERLNPRIGQIHLIPNGTVNHIVHGLADGKTLGQMVDNAVALGYAEPDAVGHLDVINGEVSGDIPKKASILFNLALRRTLRLERIVTTGDIEAPKLTPDDLDQVVAEATDRRYVLSFLKGIYAEKEDRDLIAGFRTEELEEGWVITGGFRKLSSNPLFKYLRVPDASNVILTAEGPDESDGVFALTGPGAGPGPTSAAMVQDARHLLARSRLIEET